MIGFLRGEILENSEGKLLVGLGDRTTAQAAGPSLGVGFGIIGYLVSVPQSAGYKGQVPGTLIDLYIYSHIREDAFDLYGFSSSLEKELFLTLLTVNGVGPKSALGILSAVQPDLLISAIMKGDQHFLTQLPGIGKKTAERVVVELRDSVRKKVDSGVFATNLRGQFSDSRGASGATQSKTLDEASDQNPSEFHILRDAKAALLTLGYKEHELHSLLKRTLDTAEPPLRKAEDLIKSALRQLG